VYIYLHVASFPGLQRSFSNFPLPHPVFNA
jgi:hypothetical protein